MQPKYEIKTISKQLMVEANPRIMDELICFFINLVLSDKKHARMLHQELEIIQFLKKGFDKES
jgi:hypothetical protein